MPKPPKPRAGGTWTEARYWQFIRSGLRQISRRWPPRAAALKASRRPYSGPNARQKWEYECRECHGWFMAKAVQVDHIQPCGNLAEDVSGFIQRLFCEVEGLRVLCKDCHQARKKVA